MAPRKRASRNRAKADGENTAVEKVECPPELGPAAREEWERLAPLLLAAGRLTAMDRGPFAVYCAAYASWLEAQVILQTYGAVLKSPNGHPVQSPYVSIAARHVDVMTRLASEFGFTPARRNRLPNASRHDPSFLELTTMEEIAAGLPTLT
jgi:P27 family predicted phage terminase small subunit